MAYTSMAYIVMAYIGMAYIIMAYIGMAYIIMACIVMAYIVMASIAMAYIVMACTGIGLYSHGLYIVMAYIHVDPDTTSTTTCGTGRATRLRTSHYGPPSRYN